MGILGRSLMVLVLFGAVSLPGFALARVQGTRYMRAPEVIVTKNSQTMALLEGNHNAQAIALAPTTKVAVVDETALSVETEVVETDASTVKSNGQIATYIVREGDTLASIAEMYDVSSNTIIWANDLKSSTVKEGQELVILPVTGVRHKVKSGDTVKSIVSKYKGDLDEVLAYNALSIDSKLTVGEEIIVPDGEISAPKAGTKKSSGLAEYSGYYQKPVNGARRSQGIHGHNAVDLAGPIGLPIVASASGKVIVSKTGGYNGGYGTYVVIKHDNGTQTLYAHLSENIVSVGETVSQGQKIGELGNTGKSTGPHLHFEIRGAKNPF